MAPQTRGQKRQITTTKETTTTSPQTRGGGGGGKGKSRKRQATTKATTTRGGGGGRTTKEATTTSNENPTTDEEEEGNIQDYEEEQSSDDESYLRARETVLAECCGEKEKLKEESQKKLKSLTTYLEKMGMPAAAQNLKEAIRQVIEGSLVGRTKRDLIRMVCEYISLRWGTTRRIFALLLGTRVWDDEVIGMVCELSDDLKDLPVHVPEIEDIASDAAYVLTAREDWRVRMGKELKYRVAQWLYDTMSREETVKEWAKRPTWTIVMKKCARGSF